jgi:hypothetical protein
MFWHGSEGRIDRGELRLASTRARWAFTALACLLPGLLPLPALALRSHGVVRLGDVALISPDFTGTRPVKAGMVVTVLNRYGRYVCLSDGERMWSLVRGRARAFGPVEFLPFGYVLLDLKKAS